MLKPALSDSKNFSNAAYTANLSRRFFLIAPVLLSTSGWAAGAKIVRQGSAVVPAQSTNGPGLAGAEVYSPARAWLDVDFDLQEKADLTLMIITRQQREALSKGQRLAGDPLARVVLEGPESANHSVPVGHGNYFVGFLNDNRKAITVGYRISLRAY